MLKEKAGPISILRIAGCCQCVYVFVCICMCRQFVILPVLSPEQHEAALAARRTLPECGASTAVLLIQQVQAAFEPLRVCCSGECYVLCCFVNTAWLC